MPTIFQDIATFFKIPLEQVQEVSTKIRVDITGRHADLDNITVEAIEFDERRQWLEALFSMNSVIMPVVLKFRKRGRHHYFPQADDGYTTWYKVLQFHRNKNVSQMLISEYGYSTGEGTDGTSTADLGVAIMVYKREMNKIVGPRMVAVETLRRIHARRAEEAAAAAGVGAADNASDSISPTVPLEVVEPDAVADNVNGIEVPNQEG